MLLSMLVKLYNQQQQPAGNSMAEFGQQVPDEQTLAAMIAAKQLLRLQQSHDQQQQQQHQQQQHELRISPASSPSSQLDALMMSPPHQTSPLDLEQQRIQMLNFHRSQQPLHQLNQHLNAQQQQQQQQPFDLSIKKPSNSEHSTPTNTSHEDHTDDSIDIVKQQMISAMVANTNVVHMDDYASHSPISESPDQYKQQQPFKIIRDKDNNFSCQYCNKKYTSMGALKMHVRTHTLPCQCKICGKSFSRPWLLQGHIRTHTGEKPFKCDQCHRAFADRSNLRAHLQTHAKVKKYSCKCCLKTFSRMSLQVKHEEHCNSTASQQTNISSHHSSSSSDELS